MTLNRKKMVIHIYMLFTVMAYVALFTRGTFALSLFALGGSSGFIALGLFSSATPPAFIGILCGIWTVLFPILVIICYILTFKKHYIPFYSILVFDFFCVVVYTAYTILSKNIYATKSILPDLFISFIIVLLSAKNSFLVQSK